MGDELAGQKVICPTCLQLVRVPGGAAAARPPGGSSVVGKPLPRAATPRPAPAPLPLPAAAPKENPKWFYDRNGAPCGPVTESDFGVLAADDRVFAHTLVWTEDQARWQPAGKVLPQLFKGATADDLRPPPPWWHQAVGVGLVCLAMAAVLGAGLTFVLTNKGDATGSPATPSAVRK